VGSLIYSAIASLDGYVADERGEFEWAAPDEEVHAFVNDLERPVGTHLYGRRMYEVIWRAADKVVYSTTLATVASARTRLERSFDADEVGRSVAGAERDVSIGGPGLAAHALTAGIVDELHLIVAPVIVGGGTPWLPHGLRLDLDLLDERRFASGFVDLHYRIGPAARA